MVKGMEFVYTLSCEGHLFYVGKTNNIVKRYRQHIYKTNESTKYIIDKYLNENKIIDLNAVYYLPCLYAQAKEIELINYLTAIGHKLCNCVKLIPDMIWERDCKPKNMNKKKMIIFLDYVQKTKEWEYCRDNKLVLPEYPKEPDYE